jgi:2-methylcitrate dehydratase PrpD
MIGTQPIVSLGLDPQPERGARLDATSLPDHADAPGHPTPAAESPEVVAPHEGPSQGRRAVNETQRLAQWLVAHRSEQIPERIVHEAKRALLNFIAAALGGCRHEAVDIAVKTVLPLSGPPTASLVGRTEKLDPLHATFINGISSHVDDFDDTLPKNYIHATSAVASALCAYASTAPLSGRDFLQAFVLGFEVTSRVGNVVTPWHYDAGWHITSTASVFGVAAAIGKLRALPTQKLVWALGNAATQAAGVRETFGSMAKAMHPGRAGQNGYFSVLLAENGFTGSEAPIEGARGFAFVQSSGRDLSRLFDKLGERYELLDNTYKPFPTGIVIQPTIDACIQIHREHRPDPAAITAVDLQVAPIVFELCMKKDLKVGLEGKFSIYHAAAIGLVRGRASLDEFADAVLEDTTLARIRDLTRPHKIDTIRADEAFVRVILEDGTQLTRHVQHALGNLERPMSDRDLEDKLRQLAGPVVGPTGAERIIERCWQLERLADCRDMIDATRPQPGAQP